MLLSSTLTPPVSVAAAVASSSPSVVFPTASAVGVVVASNSGPRSPSVKPANEELFEENPL